MKRLTLILVLLVGCKALSDPTVVDPDTGVTAGEVRQRQVARDTGGIVGTVTGDPGLAFGAASLTALVLSWFLKKRATSSS